MPGHTVYAPIHYRPHAIHKNRATLQRTTNAKPFLKWAGGKFKIADRIAKYINPITDATYYEPFLGGASVFFRAAPDRAVLSDENAALISTYQCVRDEPAAVYESLQSLVGDHSADHYYGVRSDFNSGLGSSVEQAARFIYLNKAGFNGIYRVNQQGRYNVPHGNRLHLALPTLAELVLVSTMLEGAALINADFELAVADASAGDVVYFDPPYPALNDTSFFNHYTADRFTASEQQRVAAVAHELRARGCNIVVSNADTEEIRALYPGWKTVDIELRRWITSAKVKHFVREVILLSSD
jgi:DNA adenine methylase